MSRLHIQRAVDNISSHTTTVFTPIVEVVVNAIEAIEEANVSDGVIKIYLKREAQKELDIEENESSVIDVSISDNGIGFNQVHRDSFDTLYSDQKVERGGKGFGRLTCLRYFSDVSVESTYQEDNRFMTRTFVMGKRHDFIEHENVIEAEKSQTGTVVCLKGEKDRRLPKKLPTIARNLVGLLLPYFTTSGYTCPRIELLDLDGGSPVVLNDYLGSAQAIIEEVQLPESTFSIEGNFQTYDFVVRVFRFFSPQSKISKISLVAHKREVTESSLASYIPEFADEFYDAVDGDLARGRNYILKAYVFGRYLDENVQLERGSFSFKKENDIVFGISQTDIEKHAAELTKAAVADQVSTRQTRKAENLRYYVESQAPWYKQILSSVDIKSLQHAATDAEMDTFLHKAKFQEERKIRNEVAQVLSSDASSDLIDRASDLASKVSDSSKDELVHYVALRKQVLKLFERSLELTIEGKYPSEEAVHKVIFPVKTDDDSVAYKSHNLWILDERLTFSSYLASELPLNGGNTQRPDIVAYGRPVAFRAENEASNPVTIFEFKKPGRDDFCNVSAAEDPIEQIVRYVNAIRRGDYKTPSGRDISVAQGTPYYGYVVCDFTSKVKTWLHEVKNFKPMPDGQGFFGWRENINLYIEVISWDKLLKDANMRNRVFFHQLGIEGV
ncbi:ATP-binding protein [Comamonas sp. JNW]|nr:ATP-binding protein [Comamonas sp. JNW]